MKPRLRPYFDHITIAVLAAACYVFFFHGLNSIGLIGPDEPRYAAIARDMLLTGDYITPRLNGVPWFEKPVLMYWLSAAGDKVFCINDAVAKFPSGLRPALCSFRRYVFC